MNKEQVVLICVVSVLIGTMHLLFEKHALNGLLKVICIQGGPKKRLWCDLEEKFLRNSKIFFDGVFLSIYSHLLKNLELSNLIEKKLWGSKNPKKIPLSKKRHIFLFFFYICCKKIVVPVWFKNSKCLKLKIAMEVKKISIWPQ